MAVRASVCLLHTSENPNSNPTPVTVHHTSVEGVVTEDNPPYALCGADCAEHISPLNDKDQSGGHAGHANVGGRRLASFDTRQ